MKKIMLCSFFMFACGGGDNDESFTCSKNDRTGTYLLSMVERNGDCGPVPDTVGRLDNADAQGNCEILEEVWEDNFCTLTRSIKCIDEPTGYIVEGTAITTQQDDNGDLLTGVNTSSVRDSSGNLLCVSSYDMTAEKQ